MYRETAQFYDFFASGGEEARVRASFLSSLIDGGSFVIDAGAGTGDVAFLLAEWQHRVFCFEPSPSMHALLLDRLRHRELFHRRVSVFPLKVEELSGALDADAAIASSVFSHIAPADRLGLLQGLHRQLCPGGLFVFNCVQSTPKRCDQPLAEVSAKKVGELWYRHFASSLQVTPEQRKITYRFEIQHGPRLLKAYEEEILVRLDEPEEVKRTLAEAGFRTVAIHGDYQGGGYDANLPGFVVVAERPE